MKHGGVSVCSAVGLVLAFAVPGAPSLAQTQQAAPAEPAPAASAARYSIDTRFSVLFADPKAAEVIKAYFSKRRAAAGKPEPTAEERERLASLIADMTPREVAQFPQADLDAAALAELDALLAQVPVPTPASTPAPAPTQASVSAGDPPRK